MTHWLIASNNNRFNLADCLSEKGYVDWKQGKNKYNIEDIVFIYCTAPESRIKYILKATEVNIPFSKAFDDRKYWGNIDEFNQEDSKSLYCRFTLIAECNSEALKLDMLLQHGLKGAPQSPLKINPDLLDYIIHEFNYNSVDPEFIENNATIYEGAKKQVFVNVYERNPMARDLCIKNKGCICSICGFDFEKKYGKIGKGFIHVHHIVPISKINKEYIINYEKDLIPVCPNCHAMLHKKINGRTLTIEELKNLVTNHK